MVHAHMCVRVCMCACTCMHRCLCVHRCTYVRSVYEYMWKTVVNFGCCSSGATRLDTYYLFIDFYLCVPLA